MHVRSYIPRLIAGLVMTGALLVPTVANADTDTDGGLTVIGNPRTTRYYDASGAYAGSSTTTSPITVIGDGLTVIGNPRSTQYYDAAGDYIGSSTTTSPITIIGDGAE